MQKVLMVGSSYGSVPILHYLKKQGFHITVCGNIKDDPAHHYSDESLHIDYSEYELFKSHVHRGNFHYIVPTCNDTSYLACSRLAAELGYSGFDCPESSEIIHNKAAFRNFTRKHDLPAPKALVIKTQVDFSNIDLSYPILVKPSDAFSGRGIRLVNGKSQLSNAVEHALSESRNKVALIEEFKTGSLHSHSAFIKQQVILRDFFVDEYCSVYPFRVDCSNHPSRLNDSLKIIVRDVINKISRILGLQDGLLHTQFIADGNRIWLIECMRRCPGDLYHRLIEISTGYPYLDFYVNNFVATSQMAASDLLSQKPIARHTVSLPSDACIFSFSESIPAPKVLIAPTATSGQLVRSAPFGKIAILFAEFGDCESMWTTTPNIADYVHIESLVQSCRAKD